MLDLGKERERKEEQERVNHMGKVKKIVSHNNVTVNVDTYKCRPLAITSLETLPTYMDMHAANIRLVDNPGLGQHRVSRIAVRTIPTLN